jgi:hypothetical protein
MSFLLGPFTINQTLLAVVTACLNVPVLYVASDGSWGMLGMMVFGAPVANGAALLVGVLIALFHPRGRGPGQSFRHDVAAAASLSLGAAAVDYVLMLFVIPQKGGC